MSQALRFQTWVYFQVKYNRMRWRLLSRKSTRQDSIWRYCDVGVHKWNYGKAERGHAHTWKSPPPGNGVSVSSMFARFIVSVVERAHGICDCMQVINLESVLKPTASQRFLTLLPPWHMYERSCEYFYLSRGTNHVYTNVKSLKVYKLFSPCNVTFEFNDSSQ